MYFIPDLGFSTLKYEYGVTLVSPHADGTLISVGMDTLHCCVKPMKIDMQLTINSRFTTW